MRSPRLSATTRYLVWWLTLVLVLGCRWRRVSRLAAAGGGAGARSRRLTPVPLPELPLWPLTAGLRVLDRVGRWCRSRGVTISVARPDRARGGGVTPFPAARELRADPLGRGAGARAAARGSCALRPVAAAAVFGLGPAIIAVSPDSCARLTDEELDQVVLHEWAHVQRRDDFAGWRRSSCGSSPACIRRCGGSAAVWKSSARLRATTTR